MESNEFYTLRDSLLKCPFDFKYHFVHYDFSNAAFGKIQTIASWPTVDELLTLGSTVFGFLETKLHC